MSKTGIYENLPLQALSIEDSDILKAETEALLKAKKLSHQTPSASKAKKRKSASEIPKLPVNKGKPSKSVSETFGSSKRETSSSSETLKANEDAFSSYETSPKTSKEKGEETKVVQKLVVHSTPTSILDDGYESCNSTPHGSGRFSLWISQT